MVPVFVFNPEVYEQEEETDRDTNPMSLVSMMLTPALWWTIPANRMNGEPEKNSVLPITRTGQAIREIGGTRCWNR